MTLLKRLVLIALLLLVLVFGVLFSVQNDTPVPLDLLLLQLPAQRLALWVLLAFAFGGVVGIAISLVAIVQLKSSKALLKRKLSKLEQESLQNKSVTVK